MKPEPIETAPRDGREIFLVSVQEIEGKSTLVSIHNGYWLDDRFRLGQPHHDLRVGDECATHWLPRDALEI